MDGARNPNFGVGDTTQYDEFVKKDLLAHTAKTNMDEIRERLLWVKENSPGITRHHVHLELKKLGLLPKKK